MMQIGSVFNDEGMEVTTLAGRVKSIEVKKNENGGTISVCVLVGREYDRELGNVEKDITITFNKDMSKIKDNSVLVVDAIMADENNGDGISYVFSGIKRFPYKDKEGCKKEKIVYIGSICNPSCFTTKKGKSGFRCSGYISEYDEVMRQYETVFCGMSFFNACFDAATEAQKTLKDRAEKCLTFDKNKEKRSAIIGLSELTEGVYNGEKTYSAYARYFEVI